MATASSRVGGGAVSWRCATWRCTTGAAVDVAFGFAVPAAAAPAAADGAAPADAGDGAFGGASQRVVVDQLVTTRGSAAAGAVRSREEKDMVGLEGNNPRILIKDL